MQKVLTAEEIREVDRLTTEKYGIPSIILMENAAHAAARVILENLGGSVTGKSVLILCGKGNNGGDGAALGRVLWMQGAKISIYLFGKIEETKGDTRTNFEIIKKLNDWDEDAPIISCIEVAEGNFPDLHKLAGFYDVFVDAIFGTGLNRELEGDLKKIVLHLHRIRNFRLYRNLKRPLIISLDVPSGMNADSEKATIGNFTKAKNVVADLTVTFTAPKLANIFPPASNFNGELQIVNIGTPEHLVENTSSQLYVSEWFNAFSWLVNTKVHIDSYKKTRGTALIVAGSENYSGAAVLAANACFAAGAGMVSVAVPQSVNEIVATKTSDEIIVKTLETTDVSNEKVDVVAIGCGLANDKAMHKFIRETVENRQTSMVLDAEALNTLSPFDLQGSDEFPLILTPHIGEFKRLLGREVGEDKIAEVREFSQKHNVILVLKGERSLIAMPDGTVVINPTGNPGISRAGAGDTLTGIITSFLAQTFAIKETNIENTFEAVVAALYIAGLAGDIAAEKFSERLMTATDVRNCLNEAIERINK